MTDDDKIQKYLLNVPDILKYRTGNRNEENNTFNNFQELPLEIREKILYLEPKYSLALSKSYQKNTLLESNYYDKYCLATSVSENELKKYLVALEPGDDIMFSYYIIAKNRDNVIFNKTEVFRIAKLKQDMYLVLNRGINNYFYYSSGIDNLLEDIFENIEKIYLFIPEIDILKQILGQRRNCNDKNYIEKYILFIIKEFLDYFVYFPLVIADFADNYLETPAPDDNSLVDELSNLNKGDFVIITDKESIDESKHINETIMDDFRVRLANFLAKPNI
jgi:hypothetical protein